MTVNTSVSTVGRLAALAMFSIPAWGQAPAHPCSAPEFRQFDFWLGDWEVRGPAGRLAGLNKITREYNGCVIHEHYDTGRGYKGESLNTYDAGRKVWHQTWVDDSGLILILEGGLQDGKMVLEGDSVSSRGVRTWHRITWTPGADGSVRQYWESTDEAGDWTVAFDGQYTRSNERQ